ncbi:unnamed protein product [Cylicocyclus nassatus]|uniref:DNA2/NAM7 helicase-like C-terminal domain-containing protein n=1 Tax=Cylicocyclus nassatus TaxID=53992 RepID=A0AA36HG05_CYLNA|nr:unnamed protein product [Cylicocyclus nassatus]
MLLNVMRVPDGRTPFLMLDVAENAERAASRSYYNDAEAQVCQAIVERLRACHIQPDSMCILTFYKKQLRRLSTFAQQTHVEVATVDSIQGREKDIVILLTTRTDIDPDSTEFLDDRKRLNVALTRARHGLLLLGHVASLAKINSWTTIIQWANSRRSVIQAAQLSTYLPPS